MYVLGLHRRRGAYSALDPGVAPYLVSSAHDDQLAGTVAHTAFGRPALSIAVGVLVLPVATHALRPASAGARIVLARGRSAPGIRSVFSARQDGQPSRRLP